MRKKLVLVGSVTPEFGGNIGGIATHVVQLAQCMSKHFTEVFVLSNSNIDRQEGNIKYIGVMNRSRFIRHLLIKPLSTLKSIGCKNKLILNIVETLLDDISDESEIIHVHSLHNPYIDIIQRKRKTIVTDHGFWQNGYDVDILNMRISNAISIISVSEYAKKRLVSVFSDAESKTKVIYNPIKEVESETVPDNERNIILFNGYCESVTRKGFDMFLNLARSNPNEKFIAIADQQASALALDNQVRNIEVVGRKTFQEVNELYCKSKLMILPSRSESFGLVYIEACMQGVPVIGASELIREFNENIGFKIGFEFDSNTQNNQELNSIFKTALSENWNRRLISKNTSKFFGWDEIEKKFVELYMNNVV